MIYARVLDLDAETLAHAQARQTADVLCRQAIQVCGTGHPLKPSIRRILGWILFRLFQGTGTSSYLEDAIHLQRAALTDLAVSDIHRHRHLRYLGIYLICRYELLTEPVDLDSSLSIFEDAIRLCPPTHIDRSRTVHDMLSAVYRRFEWSGKLDDLSEAILFGRQADDALPENHPRRFSTAHNLSTILALRFSEAGNIADLDDALFWGQRAASTILPSHSAYLDITSDYISRLCTRFETIHSMSDLETAISLGNECLAAIPDTHVNKAKAIHCLSRALLLRGRHTNNRTTYCDIPMALSYLEEALIDDERDVRSRIQYVTHVLDLIQQRHQDVFKAESPTTLQLLGVYERVVGLLPLVAYFDLHPRARLRSLTIGQSTAITGASLALQLSRPEKALELLEQGRAIFWTHTLHLRSPFDAVPDAFRDRLATLAQQLDKVCDSSQENNDARIVDAQISRRRKQTEEFNLLLDEVRKIPGMEHFLMPLPFSVLTRAAERGPVVVLVPSSMACHALILKSCGHMIKIPLEPVVTESWLADTGAGWRTAVANARSVSVDRLKMSKTRPTQRVDNILRRLWHSIVKPVLTALEISVSDYGAPWPRPRLWWCPTGPFVHLPIHAAGADGQWCSDYVVSSYTPTLSALLGIRLNYTPVKKQDVRALVAAVPRPHAQQWSDLASTREELDLVQASLPAGSLIPLSTSDNASVLIGSRDGATILHLACHAHQDPDNPLESGFVMHDEMLTIEKLMAIPLQRAFMAFLSACETAKGDKNQPDQTIHLAATMLYAGFKTVIATLWCVRDTVCALCSSRPRYKVHERLGRSDRCTNDIRIRFRW
ncbi:hypothetical protein PUNSTDRAFT_75453 [Punctularia strigosozonata HHB-11173 SS5]|uniref:CHAT domain-containing protein n=1 Tax=Punctularia strigosozonata (strain HHB-11173) TaxID=741275 RepID=R7S374_PUNST|nr:uncharacterized protein PUNSTDRAFT_75453 [Punctularia strigosozonata HHB-11173 SS5]EIN04850.1 hypothetical protein PUNSTDRAFT_75453 [Punctularia strigosozonata HHB-11173 SS5]